MTLETILIFRIGSLGDTVVALPCFHRIARSFPDSRRIVVTDTPTIQKSAPVESVLNKSGLIDGVIYFPPPPRRLRDFLAIRRQIRATEAKTLVYVADRRLLGTLRDAQFFWACGIRKVIGAPLTRDLQKLRLDPTTGDTEREAERLVRCLASLGPIDLDDPASWDLRLTAEETRSADRALAPLGDRPFVAASIGGKVRAKDWGDDNWTALLKLMALVLPDVGLAFFGSAEEFERSQKLAGAWQGPKLNLCGRLVPRESAAAMRHALLFLGHDCGPMHLAAAMGVRCVAMFGDVNMPKWWHPMGHGHNIIHDMRGIREILPDRVLSAVAATVGTINCRLHPTRNNESGMSENFAGLPTATAAVLP
jgi:heptosyltransferase-3